jgi:hypothetical protein
MDWSGPIWDFYRLMGAVLAANLLTVAFVWALMGYTRLEKEGREKQAGGGYISTMLFVFGALAFSAIAYGAFDGLFARFN